jgi:quercetin dioxygenase-like cupin family protein
MKMINSSDLEPTRMDNDKVKGTTGRVMIGRADGAPNFCMRFIEIAPGGYSPRHSHDWEHEIFIHEGKAEVLKEGQFMPAGPGTAVFIPGGEEHQIRNPGDRTLKFLCLIPAGPPEL